MNELHLRRPTMSAKGYRRLRAIRLIAVAVMVVVLLGGTAFYPRSEDAFMVFLVTFVILAPMCLVITFRTWGYRRTAVPGHILGFNAYAGGSHYRIQRNNSYDRFLMFVGEFVHSSEPPSFSITVQSSEDRRNTHTIGLTFEHIKALHASGSLEFHPDHPVLHTLEGS